MSQFRKMGRLLVPARLANAQIISSKMGVKELYDHFRKELAEKDRLPNEVVAIFDKAIEQSRGLADAQTALTVGAVLSHMKKKFMESELYKSDVPVSVGAVADLGEKGVLVRPKIHVVITKEDLRKGSNHDKRDNAICECVNAAMAAHLGLSMEKYFETYYPAVLACLPGKPTYDSWFVGIRQRSHNELFFEAGFPGYVQEWIGDWYGRTQSEIETLPEIEFDLTHSQRSVGPAGADTK